MTRYWIGVASREHVQRGVAGGFAQLCHGKPGPLKCMSSGDWIIYYSPTILFKGKDSCQSFTAIGWINSDDPYTFAMNQNFVPWRRNVSFLPSQEVSIKPLLGQLTFIKNKKKMGLSL